MTDDRAPVRVVIDFTLGDLRPIRALVEDMASAAGLTPELTADLVLAVSEIAANAIQHAGGCGQLTAVRSRHMVSVVISDNGTGLPHAVDDISRPDADSVSGRGLWMARNLFPDLHVVSSPRGLTVTMVATEAIAA